VVGLGSDESCEFVQVVQGKAKNGHDPEMAREFLVGERCSKINSRSRSFNSNGTFSAGRIRCRTWGCSNRASLACSKACRSWMLGVTDLRCTNDSAKGR